MVTKNRSFQVDLKMLLTSVFLVILSTKSAHAVSCSTPTAQKCEQTMYTNSTCQNFVCVCNNGFPIRTGCARYLKTRVTLADSTRTNIAKTSSGNVVLSCAVDDLDPNDAPFVTHYQWMKNSENATKTDSPSMTITIPGAATIDQYKCRALLENTDQPVSQYSDPLNITVVADLSTVTFKLTVKDVPTAASATYTYMPTCSGLPFGDIATIKFKNLTQEVDFTGTMQASTSGNITCRSNSNNRITSDPIPSPTVAVNISSVDVVVATPMSSELVYKVGTSVTVSCKSTPTDVFMKEGTTATVKFNITDNNAAPKPIDPAANTYVIADSNGNHSVYCTASYKDLAPIKSATKFIQYTNNYLSVSLEASGTELLASSRLVLYCKTTATNVVYSWKMENTYIQFQHDNTIQLDNVQNADAVNYICLIKRNNYEVQSNPVKINITTEISAPAVSGSENEPKFYIGETYTLECRTSSMTAGMIYTWKKDGNVLNQNIARTLLIPNMNETNNGNYSCIASFITKNSTESPPFNISALPHYDGKPCTKDNAATVCKGNGYTQVCSSDKPYRCLCAAKYERKKDVCQKGTAIFGSVFLIFVAVFISKVM